MARVLGTDQVRQAGALFVDVGGGTTDVALVRQGGIEGTRMFALGGRAFTKSIADRLDLPFPRAEALKVDYARGLESSASDDIASIIGEDVAGLGGRRRARDGGAVGRRPAAGPDLPVRRRRRVCRRSAAALAAEAFWKRMPFARPPEVTVLSPDQIETVVDATDLLVDQQDVTPLGLAYQAIELQTTADPLDVALKRVLRAMKV